MKRESKYEKGRIEAPDMGQASLLKYLVWLAGWLLYELEDLDDSEATNELSTSCSTTKIQRYIER